jgi:serine/threonine protein kinase
MCRFHDVYIQVCWVMLQLSEISICFSIFGLFFGCILISYILKMITDNQHHAYFGDKQAMAHLLLPCYKPLIRSLWAANILLIFIQLLILLLFPNESYVHLLSIQFCQLSLISLQTIPGVLLCQPSVSRSGFWRTGLIIFPWWIVSTIAWILSHKFPNFISGIVFISISAVPPFLMSLFMLIGILPSRIQLGSRSNRGCIEFILMHSLCYLVTLIIFLIKPFPLHFAFALMIFLSCQIFPITFYLCLLSDTKFWRGLGKHNSGGLISSAANSTLPELTMGVVANEFQTMIADVSSYFIDFAFIRIGPMIGSGASADVYFGEYRRKPVVLKISTPPEVTASELLIIRKETLIHSKLSHPCIVKFIGVCIRPPQIGMVVEYCDNGNLRESLQTFFFQWTPPRRMTALLDACRAVAYLHSMGYMHRDIKAENFLVTNLWKIKLADFGESVEIHSNPLPDHHDDEEKQQYQQDIDKKSSQREAETRKMTILGTIAYMAPELVEGKRQYTESIDVYALTITLWQIWTGVEPYQDIDTFSLYKLIVSGVHPELPNNSPEGLDEVLSAGWDPNPEQRLSSQQLLERMEIVATDYFDQNTNGPPLMELSAAEAAEMGMTNPGNGHAVQGTGTGTGTGTGNENRNPLRVNAIPSEDLEMLGSSSFFDDSHSHSADTDEINLYYDNSSPFKFFGWNQLYSASSASAAAAASHSYPHPPHPQLKSRASTAAAAMTHKRLFHFFGSDHQEEQEGTEEEAEAEGDDDDGVALGPRKHRTHRHHDRHRDYDNTTAAAATAEDHSEEPIQDLYQSYSRVSAPEESNQTPVVSIFSLKKFRGLWGSE